MSEDDKDRVLIKRNGEYTYFLNDIFYHQEKLSRAQLLITVLGPDHHGYVQRLLNACFFLLNYSKDNITIIMTEMINLLLPEGTKTKFSKRAGNTISLTEALKHIQINQLKFFCLEKDHRREINLNKEVLEEKQEKSLLYYIHYAVVRCFQIIKKTQEEKHLKELNFSFNFQRENWLKNGRALKLYALQTIASKDFKLNLEEEDREICNVISQFFLVLENVLTHNQPHILIYYLLKLSKC